jgi:hypothetical protein
MRVSNFLLWQISYAEFVITQMRLARFPQGAVLRGAGGIRASAPSVRRLCSPGRIAFASRQCLAFGGMTSGLRRNGLVHLGLLLLLLLAVGAGAEVPPAPSC